MRVELSNPQLVSDLRRFLQRNGCPSELRGEDIFEVRVLWPPNAIRSDSLDRAKVFAHLRDWCAEHPGVHANLLS